jgi:GTPase
VIDVPSQRHGAPEEERPRAVVLGVHLPDVNDEEFEASLRELERLADTLGLRVVGRVTQRRSALVTATVVGEGKLKELGALTGGSGVVHAYAPPGKRQRGEAPDEPAAPAADGGEASEPERPASARERRSEQPAANEGSDPARRRSARERRSPQPSPKHEESVAPQPASLVLVDQDLSPSQTRNLEKATGAEVMDRSMVILSIFQRHARTREARLQVEIARLSYMAPRLREANANQDRQRGGIGGKGAGETALELDRRRIRDRISELRRELEVVKREADTRRSRRTAGDTSSVALVGYTNAGKSSLMRALTGDAVYVADQLFATLDTTVRVLEPQTHPRVLVSDTVGFIKKLPHDLVASFRSTLEEARDASLLLHVVDASDPALRDQLQVTRTVLAEVGAADRPTLLVLNKADRVDLEQQAALVREFPVAVLMSAKNPEQVRLLHARIVAFFDQDLREEEFLIPYEKQRHVALLHEKSRVLEERYDEQGTRLRVRASPAVLAGLRNALAS